MNYFVHCEFEEIEFKLFGIFKLKDAPKIKRLVKIAISDPDENIYCADIEHNYNLNEVIYRLNGIVNNNTRVVSNVTHSEWDIVKETLELDVDYFKINVNTSKVRLDIRQVFKLLRETFHDLQHSEQDVLEDIFAAVAHDSNNSLIRYVFSKFTLNEDGSYLLSKEKAERWLNRSNKSFNELTDKEKNTCYKEAQKYLKAMLMSPLNMIRWR